MESIQATAEWKKVEAFFTQLTDGKTPDLNGILFLIGVQELGKGFRNFSKEEKQDLMHWAICCVLSPKGYYSYSHTDKDGWKHWKEEQKLPLMDLEEQEDFLRQHIIDYMKVYLE
jgi:hypothetical protein